MSNASNGNSHTSVLGSGAAARVRRVIERRCVSPVYQPLVHLATASVVGYEALTRVDADSGFSTTAELFDAALLSGTLWDLESVTRARSLQPPLAWPENRLLFLNCNPEVAADPRFATEFLSALRAAGSPPASGIVVEITERAETQFMKGLSEQVRRLRAAGIQIAIDDMGAGTSGLQRIMELRPDWLKLDRDLIANIDSDPFTQNLIDVLLRFTRVSGARLVAEGVERREQVSVLLDLGVPYVQGFLLGRPSATPQEPEEALRGWIGAEVDRVESSRITQHLTFLAGIARDAPGMDASTPAHAARRALLSRPEAAGIVVTRNGACTGWVDRGALLGPEAPGDSAALADLARAVAPPAPATTLVSEALLYLSARPGMVIDPIVLDREGDTWGVVTISALLREAARMTSIADRSYAEISGLPGRVKTDQRIASFLRRSDMGHALFVDIRGLNRYNEEFGFDLGDLILRILAGVLVSVVDSADAGESGFAGHLGDDRFVVVMHCGDPDEIAERIVREFEHASDRFVSCAGVRMSGAGAPAAGLRVIGMEVRAGVFASARDLHNAARRTRMLGTPRMLGRSHISVAPTPPAAARREERRIA